MWNTVTDNTNVWRLKSLLASKTKDVLQQLAYYHKGVGTTFGSYTRGGMLGYPDRSGLIKATPLFHKLTEAARDIRPKLIGLDTAADITAP